MQQKEINRFNYYYWQIIGLLFTIVVSIAGCSATQSDIRGSEGVLTDASLTTVTTTTDIPSSVTPKPSSTVPPIDTALPPPSTTPSPTTMITSIPSATPTATSTPTPTLLPLPTIPPQGRGQVYTDLMSSNGNCTLPCWWGFELGETSIDEIRQFYMTFDTFISEQVSRSGISVLTAKFEDPQIENGIQVRHTFVAQDNVIIEAEIEVNIHPNYQIEPILQQLGQPSEVWMWTIPEPREGVLPASFLLYFPARGILVSYAVFAERVDDSVKVCFDEDGSTMLLLWKPAIWDTDENKGFVERANESSSFTLQGERPIDEVSNWDVEQFYAILVDPTRTECLETPSDLWAAP